MRRRDPFAAKYFRTARAAGPLIAAALIALTLAPARADVPKDIATVSAPATPYTGNLEFDILREEEPVGSHRVRFERRPDGLFVRAQTEIALRFLFLTAYRFTYESESLWHDGTLRALAAQTDDDGAVTKVSARRDRGALWVDGSGGSYWVKGPIYPTDHWHRGAVGTQRVLNTITGTVNKVQVIEHGPDKIETPAGPLRARRFSYTGELTTDVWYDDVGRWVAMQFEARDGSTIRYVCRNCSATQAQATTR